MNDAAPVGEASPASPAARVAMVTGANRGLGLAIARRLGADGHRVVGTYRTDHPDDGCLEWVRCDVTDSDSVDAAFADVEERLGPVEILVANAGIARDGLVVRMSDDDFDAVIDANLTGAFRVSRRAAKRMMRGRWGRIVLISSVAGTIGSAGQANYAAAKAGLNGYARSLARELATRNITVNVVAPGPIDTDMTEILDDSQRQALLDLVPMARMGEPGEVAAAVAFLASEDASYITGALLGVDGGLGMR